MVIAGYDDIPGTTVFDAERSRQGYHLNMFCMSLMTPANRAAFKSDEYASWSTGSGKAGISYQP
jgi:protocatechuate 4,5-dioxygenase alpha subunit